MDGNPRVLPSLSFLNTGISASEKGPALTVGGGPYFAYSCPRRAFWAPRRPRTAQEGFGVALVAPEMHPQAPSEGLWEASEGSHRAHEA